jgi:hypothetical protein
LLDLSGKVILQTNIHQGSTIGYFDTKSIYAGVYLIKITDGINVTTKKAVISK